MSELIIHTDGGARGNPGPAAIGIVMERGDWCFEHGRYIGKTTNNIAEYTGVLDAIGHLSSVMKECGDITGLHFFLDSELVVRQLNGQYRVKEPTLQNLHQTVLAKLRQLGLPYRFSHVRREQNKRADLLVNQALDAHLA